MLKKQGINMVNLRKADINDAEALSIFVANLDNESEYLLYDPGERNVDINIIKSYLLKIIQNDKSIVYVAVNEHNQIIGFACGEVPHLKRVSHVMKGNMGVLKNYHGDGIGRMLGKVMLEHAEKVGIKRIELTIVKNNKISFNLSKKFGFELEGIKRCSIKIGDKLYDEYILSKIFSDK